MIFIYNPRSSTTAAEQVRNFIYDIDTEFHKKINSINPETKNITDITKFIEEKKAILIEAKTFLNIAESIFKEFEDAIREDEKNNIRDHIDMWQFSNSSIIHMRNNYNDAFTAIQRVASALKLAMQSVNL